MRKGWRQTLYHLVLWLVALVFFLPVIWVALAAIKTKSDLLAVPPKWIFAPTLVNITDLVSRPNFFRVGTGSLGLSGYIWTAGLLPYAGTLSGWLRRAAAQTPPRRTSAGVVSV